MDNPRWPWAGPRRFAPFTQLRISRHAAVPAVAPCPTPSAEQASSLPTDSPPVQPARRLTDVELPAYDAGTLAAANVEELRVTEFSDLLRDRASGYMGAGASAPLRGRVGQRHAAVGEVPVVHEAGLPFPHRLLPRHRHGRRQGRHARRHGLVRPAPSRDVEHGDGPPRQLLQGLRGYPRPTSWQPAGRPRPSPTWTTCSPAPTPAR